MNLADFASSTDQPAWRIVNDDVMGGRSRSTFEQSDGHATFAGTLSPENNGGFASVRTQLGTDVPADADAITIRVRGDGKRYELRLRMDEGIEGAAYKHTFETKPGQWLETTLPFSDFESTYRGRPMPSAPALEPAKIRQIGILIADQQHGGFALELESIRAVRQR